MNIWMNSSLIKDGDIFLVDETNKKYVSAAIKNGASSIVTSLDKIFDIKTIRVENLNEYIKKFYYKKISKLRLIGITGTNGKTTTCYLIYQLLNLIGVKTAYIGTIGYIIDDNVVALDNTTPSIDVLYYLLNNAYDNNCIYVVMEVSSHALKQDRIYGISYDVVAVTNITLDHLDYHKTFKDYINSKKLIINKTKNNKICILNNKSKYYKKFINKNNKNIIIGKDIKIKKIRNDINNTSFVIKENNEKKIINIPLIGKFNIYNFIIAYKIINELGYKVNDKYYLLLKEPKGRMEKINYKNNAIFIDYAHTPDAVSNVLKTVNKIKNKGIITIIGCGGNRDKKKRPQMAKIALKNSLYVIFTNDNPRYEDEKIIINDMIKNQRKKNYEIIYDRKQAIKKGINLLDNDMILMILGKGHEEYQIIGNNKIYFSDQKCVNDIINEKL